MKLTDSQVERIEFWIKTTFYYVGYPEHIDEYWWVDREGKWMSMDNMQLDHLKASANLIKRDVKQFMNSTSKKETNYDVFEQYLLIPAKIKCNELEEVLKKKVLG